MKMLKRLSYVALIALLSTALSSCDGTHNGDEPTPSPEDLTLKGAIIGNTVLKSETYTLAGKVEVKKGATLTIPAGTTIKAAQGFDSYILVEQGGKININGTAAKPVRMIPNITPSKAGYWGGLIINGYAPLTDGATGTTEIDPSKPYGGNQANDNSGSITYLILDGTGAKSSADVEHNGITLNGVGNGTKIENIFVLNGADDAIEFFGGTVNVSNILAVDSDDDMFDFTQGYSGTLKNAYGVWTENFVTDEEDPRGVEADGNLDGKSNNGTPQSNFRIENITIDLRVKPTSAAGTMHDVFKIRRGAKATIVNALVKGQGQVKDIVDFTDKKGNGNASSSIEYTTKLSTTISGKAQNGEGVVVIKDQLKGTDPALFGWTKYQL